MPLSTCRTLTQYLIEQRRHFPSASGTLNALILDLALACKAIARSVALGSLADPGLHDPPAWQAGCEPHVQGELPRPLDVISNEVFIRTTPWSGSLAGMASQQMQAPHQIPRPCTRGKYLLVFDPLNGGSNIDMNVSVGSIFSILRLPQHAAATSADPVRERDVDEADFLQPGMQQVAAGYAIYGPATMLVLTVGSGVVGFTLDPTLGEFKLTHPDIRVPADTQEFAINTSSARAWEPPVKRYVDECLAGKTGPRGKDFNMRWIDSMVAEAHRILMRGGVFMQPRDNKDPKKVGRLRLLHQANPIAFIVEQAGGRASTGRQPVLGLQPSEVHQCVGLVFGSRNEVERIERYHADSSARDTFNPLFSERSVFRR